MSEEIKSNVQGIITIEPGLLGVPPDSLYITDKELMFGTHNVSLDEIEDIELTNHNPRDWMALSAIFLHVVTGSVLAYTLPVSLFWEANIVVFASLIGWSIVKIIRETPYAYVSITTTEAEYQFGIATALDAANLFAAVGPHLDRELSHTDFVASE